MGTRLKKEIDGKRVRGEGEKEDFGRRRWDERKEDEEGKGGNAPYIHKERLGDDKGGGRGGGVTTTGSKVWRHVLIVFETHTYTYKLDVERARRGRRRGRGGETLK